MVAPSMPIAVTRARPKVSAKAVADVRRGLRCEFVAANAPTAPKGAPMSLPKSGTIGRLRAGPAMKKPTITPNAPTPTSDARLPVVPSVHKAPQIAKAMPAPRMIRPMMVRTFNELPAADSVVRMASTGSTPPARRAGAHAEITVTMVPRMIGTTTALTVSPSPPPIGRSWVLKPSLMSATRPMPATTPTAEPIMPTMTDSVTTERVICPREAPKARNKANSLVRWATIIEKVLAMMKVPTSSAIRPKAMRK